MIPVYCIDPTEMKDLIYVSSNYKDLLWDNGR